MRLFMVMRLFIVRYPRKLNGLYTVPSLVLELTIFVQSFHQVPITAGWPEAMWIPKLAQGFH
jgi:hypothetical protein